MEREKKQEKDSARQEQKLSILNHQVTAARSQPLTSGSSRVGEPKLMRLEDSNDIEHFLQLLRDWQLFTTGRDETGPSRKQEVLL